MSSCAGPLARAALALAAVASGCFNPAYPEPGLRCSEGCPPGQTCTDGVCGLPGDAGPSDAAYEPPPCEPTTCAARVADCDMIDDGCGGTLSCGTCTAPETCGGGGQDNACGCARRTCAERGFECDVVDDGCGGTIDCGACASPQVCGATSPNVCNAPGMVTVPGGPFQMGCNSVEGEPCDADELPYHEVTIPAFEIDRTEVTAAAYQACMDAGACGFASPSSEAQPIVGVSWEQATTYCAWVGKRLPTEAEWEKAARGTTGQRYPWGDGAISCAHAAYDACGLGAATDAGSHPDGASPYGAVDLAGNVWEWVADWYAVDAYASSPAASPTGPADGTARVVRGGSFSSTPLEVRAANRDSADPAGGSSSRGFRCARSVTP